MDTEKQVIFDEYFFKKVRLNVEEPSINLSKKKLI